MRAVNPIKLLILASLIILFSCSKKEVVQEPVAKKIDAQTVEVKNLSQLKIEKIQKTLFPETVEVTGKITIPDQNIINVTARVQGRVEDLKVTVGDRVKEGQILGSIWSSDLITAVEEYKMAVKQNDKELIQLSNQKLKALGLNVSDVNRTTPNLPFRSPINGVVIDKKINPGAAVNLGDPILIIAKNTTRQFVADVPPDTALKLKVGMKVRFPEHNSNFSAVVSNVSPIADPASNMVKVRCEFTDLPPAGLPQETYLKAEIAIKESESTVIPLSSLIVVPNGDSVFIQDQKNPNRFVRTMINVISKNKVQMNINESNQVKEGLNVVSDGALLLEGIIESDE